MGRGGNVHSCEVELAQVRHLGDHLEQQLPLLLVHHCRALHPSVVLSHLQLLVRPFYTINPLSFVGLLCVMYIYGRSTVVL